MKNVVLALSATALISVAGFVAAQTAHDIATTEATITAATTSQPDRSANVTTRLAASDTSDAVFRRLDTDGDGRISGLEAAREPKIAAGFSQADKDHDGYLSAEEFKSLSAASSRAAAVDASSPNGDQVSDPGGDRPATAPSDTDSSAASSDGQSPAPRARAHPRK